MDSHGCAGGDCGMSEQGQASPMERPSICVREGGQIEDRPSIRTVQSVVMGTIGTEDARVEGCDRR